MIHRLHHPLLVYLSDVIGVGLAWWGAYLIRFNFSIPPEFLPGFLLGLVIVVVLQGLLLRVFGLYRSLWLFASLPDLLCIGRAVAVLDGRVFVGSQVTDEAPPRRPEEGLARAG